MKWSDFQVHFDEVYACKYCPKQQWPHQGQITGEWKGATAGGCLNYASVKNNPQFSIMVQSDKPTDLSLFKVSFLSFDSVGLCSSHLTAATRHKRHQRPRTMPI